MNQWRVIVADQDPRVRERVRKIVAELGGYAVAVDSGTQALHVLYSDAWLAAICSDRLRPPNGIRLVGLARREGIATPFLLLSATAADDDQHAANARDVVVLAQSWKDDELRALLLHLVAFQVARNKASPTLSQSP